MLGINYFKAEPTEFARIRVGGKVAKEGAGIASFYVPFRTTIELVSMGTNDQPFSFQEITQDNQEVTIQGGLVYKVADPKKVLEKYNFSIHPLNKTYMSDDHQGLSDQLVHYVQQEAKRISEKEKLESMLGISDRLVEDITKKLKTDNFEKLGIEVGLMYITSIKPKPEIAKALEADYRETLLQQQDLAIHARQLQAQENARKLKEKQMQTDIDMENRKKDLVELQGQNTIKEAEFKAQAITKEMDAYNQNPALLASLGFYLMGKNAQNIGNLTITPDVMAALMKKE
jgi:regulator of protease activity HflC (stomatin/prohibitin superfamily)